MARALYIHWPFCLAKCPYCDFNSHVRENVDQAEMVAGLLTDMRHESELASREALTSIFFGGGTPSLMEERTVAVLLEEAEQLWGFAPDIEITLEANPTSFEAKRFAGFSRAGVNRVSIGVQSFQDEALKFLGREHDVKTAQSTIHHAQTLFDRVSFDLIYALPDQTLSAWEAELSQALKFGTDHLSLYQLTIEEGTRFATDVRRNEFVPMDDDEAADFFALTQDMMGAAGMPAYEISNHARAGQESRHNLTYWRYQDYIGIGAGAHGRRGNCATQRHKKPENWLNAIGRNGHGVEVETPLIPREQATEALLMGLRLREGIAPQELCDRFGLSQEQLLDSARVNLYLGHGMIWRDKERLGVTPKGMPVLNSLLGELVPASLAV